jgi:hypothetical protein
MTFVKELTVKRSKNLTAEQKKNASEKIKEMEKEDSKLVKGVFKNHECKGACVEFQYRKYKGEPIMFYTLKDGETYEIPYGVAKHINNSKKKERSFVLNARGEPTTKTYTSSYTERYSFTPTDFN